MVANNNSSDSSDRTRSLKKKAYVRMFLKDRKYGNGHVKISGVLLPSFFRISKTDSRTQCASAISLHHPNVLRCYCIRKRKHRSIYAYEAFRCTLEDVCKEPIRFWQLDGDNRIVCMSIFFVSCVWF
ncbi:hypothetical protein AQUCO_02100122v1 [Aquilegia coerulea]|uniref:Uncharacterized protein n=1 Tax=Aquilegia coerulea TaxID=218851 RepID=A0A2G5DEX0_AQUCA|nr:hypothetical protein AQUCO_02100122v1 [Aquilegia coerulea]